MLCPCRLPRILMEDTSCYIPGVWAREDTSCQRMLRANFMTLCNSCPSRNPMWPAYGLMIAGALPPAPSPPTGPTLVLFWLAFPGLVHPGTPLFCSLLALSLKISYHLPQTQNSPWPIMLCKDHVSLCTPLWLSALTGFCCMAVVPAPLSSALSPPFVIFCAQVTHTSWAITCTHSYQSNIP